MTIVIVFVNLLFIGGFIRQVVLGFSFGNNPMNDLGLIIVMVCMFLISGILFFKQQTVITEEGIYLRDLPLDFRTRFLHGKIFKKYTSVSTAR
jgi:hypothetical protein